MLSAIPIKKLHLEDLVPNGSFRFLITKCGEDNTNLAAVKMIMDELQSKKELMAANHLFVAHSLSNSGVWGLGNFPYGAIFSDRARL